jgi:hypothetical protein
VVATQQVEVEGLRAKVSLGKIMRSYLKSKLKSKRIKGMVQVVLV